MKGVYCKSMSGTHVVVSSVIRFAERDWIFASAANVLCLCTYVVLECTCSSENAWNSHNELLNLYLPRIVADEGPKITFTSIDMGSFCISLGIFTVLLP